MVIVDLKTKKEKVGKVMGKQPIEIVDNYPTQEYSIDILRKGASIKREAGPHWCTGNQCVCRLQPSWAKGEHVSIPLAALQGMDVETAQLLDAETLFRLYAK